MTTLFYPALALHIQRTSILNANLHQRHAVATRTTGPLSLLSTPLLDSFFPYPEPVMPVPNITPFWLVDDWVEHFDIKTQAKNDGSSEFGVIVSPVAWTSMEQVVALRKGPRNHGNEYESARRFGPEVAHLAANWDSLTAGEMSCVKFDNGSAQAPCLSFQGTSGTDDIYRSVQPVFRAAPGATDVKERFAGTWRTALGELAENIGGQAYQFSSPGKVVTYRLSVSFLRYQDFSSVNILSPHCHSHQRFRQKGSPHQRNHQPNPDRHRSLFHRTSSFFTPQSSCTFFSFSRAPPPCILDSVSHSPASFKSYARRL